MARVRVEAVMTAYTWPVPGAEAAPEDAGAGPSARSRRPSSHAAARTSLLSSGRTASGDFRGREAGATSAARSASALDMTADAGGTAATAASATDDLIAADAARATADADADADADAGAGAGAGARIETEDAALAATGNRGLSTWALAAALAAAATGSGADMLTVPDADVTAGRTADAGAPTDANTISDRSGKPISHVAITTQANAAVAAAEAPAMRSALHALGPRIFGRAPSPISTRQR